MKGNIPTRRSSSNREVNKQYLNHPENKFLPESLLKDLYEDDEDEDESLTREENIKNYQNHSNKVKNILSRTIFNNKSSSSEHFNTMGNKDSPILNQFYKNNNFNMNNLDRHFQNLNVNSSHNDSFHIRMPIPPKSKTYSHNNLPVGQNFGNFENPYNSNLNVNMNQNQIPNQMRISSNQINFNQNTNHNFNNNINNNINNFNNNFNNNYNNNFNNMNNLNIDYSNYQNNFKSNENNNLNHFLINNLKNNFVIPNLNKCIPKKKTSCETVIDSFRNSNINAPDPRILNQNFINNIPQNNYNYNLIHIQNNFNSQINNSKPSQPQRKNYSSNLLNSYSINNTQMSSITEVITEDIEEDLIKTLEKIGDNLIPYIKTQKGSRSMQKFLNKISDEHVNLLLHKFSKNLKEIMSDSYANYFMQKLMHCCSSDQRIYILESISNDFLEIAINTSGTHSIQSLIEIINISDEEEILKKYVEKHILKLSCNSNGTHIIQKLINRFEENSREYLNEFIIENLAKLSINANGICVVKKFISSTKSSELKLKILQSFEKYCIEIVEDAFGNYAVQYAIDVYGAELCENIINIIINNLLSLCNQKFSSNVVEKCILITENEIFNKIVREMFFNTTNFIAIMKNKYGSFVIQKAILRMNKVERIELKDFLVKKVTVSGVKERTKFNALIEII